MLVNGRMKGIPLDPGNAEPIRIAVRIPAGMKELFDAYCQSRDTTMSDMIRELIVREMDLPAAANE